VLTKQAGSANNFALGWPLISWCTRSLLSTAIMVLGLVAAGRIYAGPIEIDLDPSHTTTCQLSVSFDALNNPPSFGPNPSRRSFAVLDYVSRVALKEEGTVIEATASLRHIFLSI